MKEQFYLLSKATGRGNTYVMFAHYHDPMKDKDTQIHTIYRGTRDATGKWKFEWLRWRNGKYTFFKPGMLATAEMAAWCEATAV